MGEAQESDPVLVFTNDSSGGGAGSLFAKTAREMPNAHLVLFPDEAETWTTMSKSILFNPNLRVVIAGGDGSTSWIYSLLFKFYSANGDGFMPPAACYPCGTGNDLARSLGWGGTTKVMKKSDAEDFIKKVKSTTTFVNMDIWDVQIKRVMTGKTENKNMTNYISIGIDAMISTQYEKMRQDCGPCICCQCQSKMLYCPAACAVIGCNRPLKKYLNISYVDKDGTNKVVDLKKKEKTVVIQSTPLIYGGQNLWRGHEPRSMCDKLMELTVLKGSSDLLMAQMGSKVGRNVSQMQSTVVRTNTGFTWQVDGEGEEVREPAEITIKHAGQYPALVSSEKQKVGAPPELLN